MKKLLASDIDGTLYIDKTLSQENTDAIRRFRKEGNLFILCTGRTPASTRQLILEHPELEIDGVILAGGGALFRYEDARWQLLERSFIHRASVQELLTYVRDEHPNFTVHWSDGERNYALPRRYKLRPGTPPPIELDLPQWKELGKDVLIAVFSHIKESPDETLLLRDEVRRRWGNHCEAHHNRYFLDISAKGCDKRHGFIRMAKLMGGIPAYAIGDGFNDAPMFDGAGKDYSFLMESGAQALLPKVRQTVKSVAECIHILLEE